MPKEPKKRQAEPPPDWLTKTPRAAKFYLLADDQSQQHSSWVQSVPLKRSEFIALKQHLAKMRGYAVPEVAHA